MTALDGSTPTAWIVCGALVVAAYLLGGIPWSLLMGKWVKGIDLRQIGSGNLGATNVARNLGGWWAAAVFALDFAKSAIPVAVAGLLFTGGAHEPAQVVTGVAAIVGHVYSPYIRFRGGKGIAPTAGVAAVLNPLCLIPGAIIFFAVGIVTRRVSVGSLSIAAAYPPLVLIFYPGRPLNLVFSAGVSALIVFAHRANIGRLIRGEERTVTWGIFKEKPPATPPESQD